MKTSLENKNSFKRSKTSDFFKSLNSIDSFINGTDINLDLENEAFETDLRTKLAGFGITLIKISPNAILSIKNKKSSTQQFKIKTGNESASKLNTAIRLINKTIFLRSIEDNKEKYFSPDVYANYDLINSVTTSGEKSKSTDVYIENSRVNEEFKQILELGNNDLTIEVKEISELSKNITGGAGIRLASGSVLAAMQNDIIFCLTIICIVTNIIAEDIDTKIGEITAKKITRDLTLGEALESLKKNQIPATKLSLLVNFTPNLFGSMENSFIFPSFNSTTFVFAKGEISSIPSSL